MSNFLQEPIFFIGAPRSGTTIISEVIFQHKDLAWPSDYQEKYPKSSRINYFRRFFDNRFWRFVGNKKQLHGTSLFNRFLFKPSECYGMWSYLTGHSVDFNRGFLLDVKAGENQKQLIRSYFTQMVRGQGKKRLSAKITGPSRIGYLLSIFPDAVFILIRRSYIPSISSLMKVLFWKDLGMRKLWWTGPYDEKEKEWAEKNKNQPHVLTAYQLKKIRQVEDIEIEKYRPNLLKINYEDFVSHPDISIKKILNHCSLTFDSQIGLFLKKNPVISRNKNDSYYFDNETLQKIRSVLFVD